jgi:protein SCO1
MNQRSLWIPLVSLALILTVGFTGYLFSRNVQRKSLAVYGEVADFRLIDHQGRELGLPDLRGKVWVADFIFTSCGGICPVMSKNMAMLHRSFRLEDDVAFVSISVNPEQDSPHVLLDYAKRYTDDMKGWIFLTGSRQDITSLAVGSFRLGSIEEPVFHSAKFVLVDRYHRIRGYYDGTDTEAVRTLFHDLAQLKAER